MDIEEQQYQWWAFELPEHFDVKVEVQHFAGPPLKVYFLDKQDFSAFERGDEWRYMTNLSDMEVNDHFDSGWRRIKTPGVYYVVVRPHEWQTGASRNARAHVLIEKKLYVED